MPLPFFSSVIRACLRISLLALILAFGVGPKQANADSVVMPGHIPVVAMRTAHLVGAVTPGQTVPMALTLSLRDPKGLQDLIAKLYDPKSSEYGHFLTADQFTQRFGPTEADYQAVIDYARQQGFTVTGIHPNRTVLDVEGTTSQVQSAFNLHLNSYQTADGHVFQAPDLEPTVPAGIAAIISGIVGLSTASVRVPYLRELSPSILSQVQSPFLGQRACGWPDPQRHQDGL